MCNHDIYDLSWIQNVTRCNAALVSFGNCTRVYEAPRRDLGLTDKTTQKSKLLGFRLELLKILCLNLCLWHLYPDKGYIWRIIPSIQPCILNNQCYGCFGKLYLKFVPHLVVLDLLQGEGKCHSSAVWDFMVLGHGLVETQTINFYGQRIAEIFAYRASHMKVANMEQQLDFVLRALRACDPRVSDWLVC